MAILNYGSLWLMIQCMVLLGITSVSFSFTQVAMLHQRVNTGSRPSSSIFVEPNDNGDSCNDQLLSDLSSLSFQLKGGAPQGHTRKQFFSNLNSLVATTTAAACVMVNADSSSAAEWPGVSSTSPERPVVVLGASGRTGMEVVRNLANNQLYTVSMTRTGVDPYRVVKLPEATKQYIQHYPEKVDVSSLESLEDALSAIKPSAIIFCASASKQGGTAFQVDDKGVGNAALMAKKLGARLVVISALAVDRPDSKSFQITNTIGGNYNGIMDAKLQGENKVRSTLADTKDFVIVRPGVLLNGKTTSGPQGIEVNQGDTIGGGLSRDELAGVVVGALKSGAKGATVEVYRRSTATKLQPEFTVPSGREISSDSYQGLFSSL